MMNFLTVGKASQGIADYIANCGKEAMDKGVVIAHDPRHFSKEFSQLAAGIFAANGIKVYTFPDLRPTPELAFMIRRLNTVSGINITASHNPREYNGYKAYWDDGCQVSAEVADSEKGFKVQDVLLSDLDGNGDIEMIVLLWKKGLYGKHRPFWVENDEKCYSQQEYFRYS